MTKPLEGCKNATGWFGNVYKFNTILISARL
jgi:hypothetical protein